MPGTSAAPDELLALGDAIGRAGHGVFQLVSDEQGGGAEREWLTEVARRTGATVTYSLAQTPFAPDAWRDRARRRRARSPARGCTIVPQVACRPTGMLFGLRSSLHPFTTHPTMRALADRPLAERVAELRKPEVRAALLAEEPGTANRVAVRPHEPLGPDVPPRRPARLRAAGRRQHRRRGRARRGVAPEEVALDWLLERDGEALLFAPLASYVDHDHEAIRAMLDHPRTVLGLSDGGAHCGLICDASFPTYLLTHWVRDRTRGARLGLERAVHLQTGRTAATYGLTDRGTIEPGKRADLNLIDLDGLRLRRPGDGPRPAGRRPPPGPAGRRLRATVVAGEVTFDDGEPTGARPGRLVRTFSA